MKDVIFEIKIMNVTYYAYDFKIYEALLHQ